MSRILGPDNRPASGPKSKLHKIGGIDVNVYEDTRVSFSALSPGTPTAAGEVTDEESIVSLCKFTKRHDHLMQAMFRELVYLGAVVTDLEQRLEQAEAKLLTPAVLHS